MTLASLRPFALNCGLLLLPAVAWNVALTKHLPAAFQPADFWREIPALLALSENGLRIAVFVLPFFMPLDLATAGKRRALLVFIAGTFVYFASWLAIILNPAVTPSPAVPLGV